MELKKKIPLTYFKNYQYKKQYFSIGRGKNFHKYDRYSQDTFFYYRSSEKTLLSITAVLNITCLVLQTTDLESSPTVHG